MSRRIFDLGGTTAADVESPMLSFKSFMDMLPLPPPVPLHGVAVVVNDYVPDGDVFVLGGPAFLLNPRMAFVLNPRMAFVLRNVWQKPLSPGAIAAREMLARVDVEARKLEELAARLASRVGPGPHRLAYELRTAYWRAAEAMR